MSIYIKLAKIQSELKAPKNRNNDFGKYKYRSAEDILEAVKPICIKNDTVLTLRDEIEIFGDRYYIKATAILTDTENGEYVIACAYAREALTKKGMDESQITGVASSYARKYALNGLFCIDDTKDADTNEYRNETKRREEAHDKQDSSDVISEEKYQNLLTEIHNKKVDTEKIMSYYKIDDLHFITVEMWSKIMNALAKKKSA